MNNKEGKERPIGVTVCSVVNSLLATALIIDGILAYTPSRDAVVDFLQKVFFVFPILFLVGGIGLWKAKAWSKVLTIILSILLFVLSFFILAISLSPRTDTGVAYILVIVSIFLWTGFVSWYLLFNKKAKEFFKK